MDRITGATPICPTGRQIYQPQFGMGNQLRALEAGLAVARILGRLLVIPDYISDNGEGAIRDVHLWCTWHMVDTWRIAQYPEREAVERDSGPLGAMLSL